MIALPLEFVQEFGDSINSTGEKAIEGTDLHTTWFLLSRACQIAEEAFAQKG
jgi:hypothetical protein